MVQQNKKFIYRVDIKWTEARKGVATSGDKPRIKVATPPEFKGHAGMWTPEDLFVASVSSCIMTTFLYYAEKHGLKFHSFEASNQGTLEKVDDDFIISTIEITPHIIVASDEEVEKAERILELSEKDCLISNSIKSKLYINPKIEVKK